MAETTEIFTPSLGAAGEPCANCSAPLAADQRYCLECGTRRGDARIAYRELLPGTPAPVAVTPRRDWRSPSSWRWSANNALITGVGCLLLALGIGVLIGRSGGDGSKQAAAPAPQIIRVGGASGTATTADAAATTDGATTASASSKAKKKKKKASKKDANTASSAAASKATNPTVAKLGKLSPKDYQKQSAKLPKQVGTGGKAPPIDKSKPAGGGSSSETIG